MDLHVELNGKAGGPVGPFGRKLTDLSFNFAP